ncbi:hypothetical protein EBB07_29285 [Paenibacillaceae bacterium]|nr:hypothetical protein EBB07_29285 [Paenibacillaceae bacterium]
MSKVIIDLESIYKIIKAEFKALEPGQQLTIVIRYGNDYTNNGQFRKVMDIVKSKGRYRNPDDHRKDWTIKAVVRNILWYKEHNFYSVEMDVY